VFLRVATQPLRGEGERSKASISLRIRYYFEKNS
jgi:hypothetical protein